MSILYICYKFFVFILFIRAIRVDPIDWKWYKVLNTIFIFLIINILDSESTIFITLLIFFFFKYFDFLSTLLDMVIKLGYKVSIYWNLFKMLTKFGGKVLKKDKKKGKIIILYPL